MRNFSLKLFSLFMAIILAYFVHNENNASVVGFVVPVEVKNLPDSKVLVWPLAPQARVTVKGPSYLTSRIATSSSTFKVSISNEAGSRISVGLSESDLALPPSVQVLSIEPKELEFVLDNKLDKKLSVHVPIVGELAKNFKLEKLKISPESVAVVGPERELRSVEKVESEPLDLRELKASSSLRLALRSPGSLSKLELADINVSVDLSVVQLTKKFENLAIELRSNGILALKIDPMKVSIEVSGTPDSIELLDANSLVPFVKIDSQIKEGRLKVLAELPANVELKSIAPEYVDIVSDNSKLKLPKKNKK